MRFGSGPQTSVKELIRTAERYIATQEYEIALEKLTRAKQLEPANTYIQAIIERINALDSMNQEIARVPTSAPGNDTHRYLSVTVGKEFDNGIQSLADVQRRVKRLTGAASQLLERGAYETAFETLMKAYLLDPTSPDVIECEKTLLPTWESMRKKGAPPTLSAAPPRLPLPSENGEQRLQALKQQKEQERLEKERAVWREASKPAKALGSTDEQPLAPPATDPQPPAEEPAPETPTFQRGILAKLRRKKILE